MAKTRRKKGRTKQKTSKVLTFVIGGLFLFIVLAVIGNLSGTSDKSPVELPQTPISQTSKTAQLSEEQRKEIWLALTQAWAQPDPQKAKEILLQEFKISSEQLKTIQQEGLSQDWKTFDQWDISDEERKQIFVDLYEMQYLAIKEAQQKYPDSPEQQEAYQKESVNQANDKILEKYHLTPFQLSEIAKQGNTDQWVKLVDMEKLDPTRKATKKPSSYTTVHSPTTVTYSGSSYSDASKSKLNMSKPVKVRGYYRQDGTYVRPHSRVLPGQGKKK